MKQFIGTIIWLLFYITGFSQVQGLSYTFSPSAEYVKWNDQAGLADGLLVGGKIGFGFGEYLELRGSYMQSLNLKTDFSRYGIDNYQDSLYTPRNVNLNRWGGELKANFSKGNFLPYVTLGTGVQSIQMDSFAINKQIYVSGGAGLKFSLGDRTTLSLEAKNTLYNFNAGNNLLTDDDKAAFGGAEPNFEVLPLDNWSLNASIQFYLGGRRPGQLSELDKAYFNAFSDGLRGLRIPIEPSLARINFDAALPFKNAWLAGGYAGIDFTPYIGIRGFYFQAMKNDAISTDFDNLSMYGGELRTKLNVSRGLTPYIVLGGGYINVYGDYAPRDSVAAESQAFAQGGLGIDLPIGSRFKLFGSARAILTSSSAVQDIQEVGGIQRSMMYSVGLNMTIGRKAKSLDDVFKFQMDTIIATKQQEAQSREDILKQQYEEKILALENDLNQAYANKDIDKAAKILKEKGVAEQIVDELNRREVEKKAAANTQQQSTNTPVVVSSDAKITMTPAEFQLLIEGILDNMGDKGSNISPLIEQQLLNGMGNNNNSNSTQDALQQRDIENKINEVEKLLIKMIEQQSNQKEINDLKTNQKNDELRRDLTEFSAKLLVEIEKLNDKIEAQNKELDNIKYQQKDNEKPIIIERKSDSTSTSYIIQEELNQMIPKSSITTGNRLGVETSGEYVSDSGLFSKLTYEGMSGFMGFNVGGQTTANVGFRWHYGIGDTPLELMNEAFFGFGTPAAFGLTVNGIYPIAIENSFVTPYFGAGGGFMQIGAADDNRLRLSYNAIVGSYIDVLGGRLYADLTFRNSLKFTQIIAGYRFQF